MKCDGCSYGLAPHMPSRFVCQCSCHILKPENRERFYEILFDESPNPALERLFAQDVPEGYDL